MTFDEVIQLGVSLIEQYEPHMKVLGRRAYVEPLGGSFGVKPLQAHDDDSDPLPGADPNRIRAKIIEVLDKLAEMKDGFVMSEPPFRIPPTNADQGLVRYKDIVLRLTYGSDASPQLKYHLWVECWYYLPAVLQLEMDCQPAKAE